jgi:phosphoribosylformimino-5-aminoimidazole carboxamide ribotide isomerase
VSDGGAAAPPGIVLFPAVDIMDGRAVRLTQGDFEQETVYAEQPVEAALGWAKEGARALHVVDLDGARTGSPVALAHLRLIVEETTKAAKAAKPAKAGMQVQYGGGLRAIEHLHAALAAGADRVVLGTAAFRDEALLDRALVELGKRLAVAVDVRGGQVATAGWTTTAELSGTEAVAAMLRRGVRRFVYTNVDRDGMLSGPDRGEVARVAEAVGGERFVYSGGVGSLDDLRALASLGLSNLEGVIVGKALYERRFSLAEAQMALG